MGKLKLTIDLLPKGAWGNNLSKTLPKKDWDIIRSACYERAKNKCTVCGKTEADLDAHEIWEFDIKKKTQTLKDIVALCSACHGVKHFRNSTRIGFGENVKRHFMNINKCNEIAFASHLFEAEMLFEKQNEVFRWKMQVDLSKFGGEGIEFEQKEVPLITNPYESVDFETIDFLEKSNGKEITICLVDEAGEQIAEIYETRAANNYIVPQIFDILADNYKGTIKVTSKFVNKIIWYENGKQIKKQFNISGAFVSELSVEDLTGDISFRLIGKGGQTDSQDFKLQPAN